MRTELYCPILFVLSIQRSVMLNTIFALIFFLQTIYKSIFEENQMHNFFFNFILIKNRMNKKIEKIETCTYMYYYRYLFVCVPAHKCSQKQPNCLALSVIHVIIWIYLDFNTAVDSFAQTNDALLNSENVSYSRLSLASAMFYICLINNFYFFPTCTYFIRFSLGAQKGGTTTY